MHFIIIYRCITKFDYLTWKDAVVATEGSEYSAAATVKGNWLSFSHYVIPLLQLGVLLLLIIIFYSQKILQIGKSLPLLFGISIPTTFVGVAGILIGNVALTYQPWGDAYKN